MFRYVILTWDKFSEVQQRTAATLCRQLERPPGKWQLAMCGDTVRIYCTGSCGNGYAAHTAQQQSIVVLGKLFQKGTAATIALDDKTAVQIARTRARHLIDNFWGHYVCVVSDAEASSVSILRDPSGIIRCFATEHRGVRLFCSHTEDLVNMGCEFTVNWHYVASELASCSAMAWTETGLNEVSALPPGVCVEVSGRDGTTRTTCYWDAVEIARNSFEDSASIAESIHSTARQCVQSWATGHKSILLLLSGGLDSSMILSCLQDMPARPDVLCLNLYHPTDRGDERRFARLAAERAGVRLIDRRRPADIRLESFLTLPMSARPTSNHSDHIMFGALTTGIAKSSGATAVFSGQMGDELFCNQTAVHAATDYVWAHGIDRGLYEVAADAARMNGLPIWRSLSRGVLHGLATRLSRPWSFKNHVLRDRNMNPYVSHRALERYDFRRSEKWVKSVDSLPVGKLLQVAEVAKAQAYFAEFGDSDDPDWILPLQSQPIVELCLRAPLFLHIRGGWRRSLLRQAFAEDMPREILERRTKGSTAEHRHEVFATSRSFLRGLLQNGILMQQGLLNRARVEAKLADEKASLNDMMFMECVKAEAWLRVWQRGRTASRHADAMPNPEYLAGQAIAPQ